MPADGFGSRPADGSGSRRVRCSASMCDEKLLFTNFGRGASHRRDLESADVWLARCLAPAGEPPNAGVLLAAAPAARRCQSPFLDLPNFNIWRVHFDALRTLDLGIYFTVMCSVLKELLGNRAVFPGPNVLVRLKQASRAYRQWCKAAKPASVVKHFTWRWVGGRFPCISQPPSLSRGGSRVGGSPAEQSCVSRRWAVSFCLGRRAGLQAACIVGSSRNGGCGAHCRLALGLALAVAASASAATQASTTARLPPHEGSCNGCATCASRSGPPRTTVCERACCRPTAGRRLLWRQAGSGSRRRSKRPWPRPQKRPWSSTTP